MAEGFSHKILIVDDEKSVGKSLGRILMAEDIDFVYVENGESAIQEIKSAEKPFSIIISDQRMPGIQGTDFLEQAKKIHPDTIRFLLTAHSDIDIIISSVNKGAVHEFIKKPWENDELLKSIETWLKQYEKNLEEENLLKIIKKQNEKLYDFDTQFMEVITVHDKKLAVLDREIEEIEQHITEKPSSSKDFASKVIKQMEETLIQEDKPDSRIFNKFYAACIKNLYDEFEEIANRNGFEIFQTIAGATDE
ncbi:MAG: response regulator [Desulfobacula sp.]|nr:response regulator [Desulfobacula sp.]